VLSFSLRELQARVIGCAEVFGISLVGSRSVSFPATLRFPAGI
jgi:hypothetical protein